MYTKRFRDIYVLPHSHFDYGYTHPQAMLMELSKDFLTEAIALCLETRDNEPGLRFKWTIEANYVLTEWLRDATPGQVEDLKQFLQDKSIAIAAFPFHLTPLAGVQELTDQFEVLESIRETLDYEVTTAVNFDVNGQPWTLEPLLRKHGIEFYMSGINVHFGGIPFERPQAFWWEGQDGGRTLSYLGEIYQMWSRYTHSERMPGLFASGASEEMIYASMREELAQYEASLAKRQWDKPFYVLTATNPPLYDNGSPDKYLVEAIRIYNRVSPDQRVQLITLDELRDLVRAEWAEDELPVKRGDWTDYWNFGAGSTPLETRMHARSQNLVQATEWLTTLQEPAAKTLRNLRQARALNLHYAEHTWGAAESIGQPLAEMTKAQRTHKDNLAWDGVAHAAYALGSALEQVNGDPGDFDLAADGVVAAIYNPTPYDLKGKVLLPPELVQGEGSTLPSLRMKQQLPFGRREMKRWVELEVPAYARRVVPLPELLERLAAEEQPSEVFAYDAAVGVVTTPQHELSLDRATGRISELRSLASGRVRRGGAYGFASVVRETLAEGQGNDRAAFSRREGDGDITRWAWNTEWEAAYDTPEDAPVIEWVPRAQHAILRRTWTGAIGTESIVLDLIFYADRSDIEVDLRLELQTPDTPLSYYLTLPTDLAEGWTGRYDTAGTSVRLDEDQLDHVSKDWLTTDRYYAAEDDEHGYLLASPDIRLVQPNGFRFGRQSQRIERSASPLHLSWICNNYWTTNFSSRITGTIHAHYLLREYTAFDPQAAHRAGIEAGDPFILSITSCDRVADQSWYRFTSESCILLDLKRTEEGMRLLVANPLATPQRFTFVVEGGAQEERTLDAGALEFVDISRVAKS